MGINYYEKPSFSPALLPPCSPAPPALNFSTENETALPKGVGNLTKVLAESPISGIMYTATERNNLYSNRHIGIYINNIMKRGDSAFLSKRFDEDGDNCQLSTVTCPLLYNSYLRDFCNSYPRDTGLTLDRQGETVLKTVRR